MNITSVENIESGGLNIYPNPASNILNIRLDNIETGAYYTVFTINGKKVLADHINSLLTTVDLSACSPGIYIMQVLNGKKIHTEKVIKK
jgi:hypothetical protein